MDDEDESKQSKDEEVGGGVCSERLLNQPRRKSLRAYIQVLSREYRIKFQLYELESSGLSGD